MDISEYIAPAYFKMAELKATAFINDIWKSLPDVDRGAIYNAYVKGFLNGLTTSQVEVSGGSVKTETPKVGDAFDLLL